MKSTLTFFAALAATAVTAQVTLTQAMYPQAGNVFSLNMSDTTGVLPGSSGTNVSWNFSSLNSSVGVAIDSFLTVASSLYGSSFPQSNLALHETGPSIDYFTYFDETASGLARVGHADSVNVITYSNPGMEYYFPMSYGTTGNDTYSAIYYDNNFTASVHVHGTTSCNADGTGTLQLPSVTLTNVLRAHFTRYEQDTSFNSNGNYVYQIQTDYWQWFVNGTYYPVLSIQQTFVDIGFSTSYIKYVGWRTPPLGVQENVRPLALDVFPNPATTTLQVNCPAQGTLRCYATDGKLLSEQTVIAGNTSIDVSALPEEMIIVEFRNGEMVLRKSIQLQH